MKKLAQFYIDDVIFVFRDITKQKPKSIFDHPFLKELKGAHDKYGLKVQLNCFYKMSFFYGRNDFDLSMMPDTYKDEWEKNSDWLKLSFHAQEEFPDYPYVNADYDLVRDNYVTLTNEVKRFAGEKSLAAFVLPHWAPMSKEGVTALRDLGVKVTYATYGEKVYDYNGEQDLLPYGHSFRFLHNRKKETSTFIRKTRDKAIQRSICGYNHITEEEFNKVFGKATTHLDKETGMRYGVACGIVLNLTPIEEIEESLDKLIGNENITVATHEQYFYPDYYAYQKDYAEKTYKMSEILHKNGYEFCFVEDLVK